MNLFSLQFILTQSPIKRLSLSKMEPETFIAFTAEKIRSETLPNYFANIFLAVDNRVRCLFAHWIRLFVGHGGVILSQEDQHLATHVLHSYDEVVFEDVDTYYNAKRALHINIEWIKATIAKGCLQDDRPYRVTLLPNNKLDS